MEVVDLGDLVQFEDDDCYGIIIEHNLWDIESESFKVFWFAGFDKGSGAWVDPDYTKSHHLVLVQKGV